MQAVRVALELKCINIFFFPRNSCVNLFIQRNNIINSFGGFIVCSSSPRCVIALKCINQEYLLRLPDSMVPTYSTHIN